MCDHILEALYSGFYFWRFNRITRIRVLTLDTQPRYVLIYRGYGFTDTVNETILQ